MKIAKNTIVTLDYRVADPAGELVDEGAAPIVYLHGGYGDLFAKLEEALEGKETGQTVKVNLLPEDAFGLYDEDLLMVEPRDGFPAELAVGMQFVLDAENGEEILYRVVEFDADKVVLDGNHPLADRALVFTCTVTKVRPASANEVKRKRVLDRA